MSKVTHIVEYQRTGAVNPDKPERWQAAKVVGWAILLLFGALVLFLAATLTIVLFTQKSTPGPSNW